MMLTFVLLNFWYRSSIINYSKINDGIHLNEIIPDIEMKPLYRYLNVIYPLTFF